MAGTDASAPSPSSRGAWSRWLQRLTIALLIAAFPLFLFLAFAAPRSIPYYCLLLVFIFCLATRKKILALFIVLPVAFLGRCDDGRVGWVNQLSQPLLCRAGSKLVVEHAGLGLRRGRHTGTQPRRSCRDAQGGQQRVSVDRGSLVAMLIYLLAGLALALVARIARWVLRLDAPRGDNQQAGPAPPTAAPPRRSKGWPLR